MCRANADDKGHAQYDEGDVAKLLSRAISDTVAATPRRNDPQNQAVRAIYGQAAMARKNSRQCVTTPAGLLASHPIPHKLKMYKEEQNHTKEHIGNTGKDIR